MTDLEFDSVFDHQEDTARLSRLRSAVIEDVCFLRREYERQFQSIKGKELKHDDFAVMREKHRALRHVGHFSGSRTLSNELIWKWTEATGKYVGCPFWSSAARELFDAEVEALGGWPITSGVKKHLEAKLQKKGRPHNQKLTHEHVYPIKEMKAWISSLGSFDSATVMEHFDRQCVACVVLESEHPNVPANHENPWLRYSNAGVVLAQNPAWPESQRALIAAAGLIP